MPYIQAAFTNLMNLCDMYLLLGTHHSHVTTINIFNKGRFPKK